MSRTGETTALDRLGISTYWKLKDVRKGISGLYGEPLRLSLHERSMTVQTQGAHMCRAAEKMLIRMGIMEPNASRFQRWKLHGVWLPVVNSNPPEIRLRIEIHRWVRPSGGLPYQDVDKEWYLRVPVPSSVGDLLVWKPEPDLPILGGPYPTRSAMLTELASSDDMGSFDAYAHPKHPRIPQGSLSQDGSYHPRVSL